MASQSEIDGVEAKGLTLTFTLEELAYAERVAWYRNARADALKKKLLARWSRKSVLESWARSGMNGTRAQMEPLEATHGPLPQTRAEIEAYAKRIADAEQTA